MTSHPSAHGPIGHTGGEIGTAWSVPPGGPRRSAPAAHDGFASGGRVFSGILLLCGGLLAVLQAVVALSGDDVYARVGSYVYALSLTGWGAIHLTLGVLAAATGAALLRGVARARPAGILLAALSLVAQWLFLPYEPPWSVTVMAIDVFVIWSLAMLPERTRPEAPRARLRG
ncbi:DUF7144 family membrane protein [Streptomyces sp. DSM 15324]|uniref:DUF7144 family membrane protein n=1 Tax=Streptomyces sp. DSM 15324 TaxID=1739111 RepID=UPI00074A7175|nr:hypothetical protein [Streptomyces sp. DSM 15324]KUO12916.1 hypothetical protein AQJ58_06895 [Streptomyces sp. DSM 15324]